MAIRDLLWACPRCGGRGSLRADAKVERCQACGTKYRRGRGDLIIAQPVEGAEESRAAAEWLDMLEPAATPADLATAGPEKVLLRRAGPAFVPVHYGRELIGWVERFGKREEGTLSLSPEALRFAAEAGAWEVPLDGLTAIQPSSSSLQLRTREGAILSVRFLESSVIYWEGLLHEAVQRRWEAAGRGRIIDFQPRIVCG